jgi:trans-aconitate methyltransferase
MVLKLEEYLQSLPKDIMSGDDVQLPEHSIREIFEFCKLGKDDVFYHLGCGDGRAIQIALEEYHVKKAVGIDNDRKKIENADNLLRKNKLAEIRCEDVRDAEFKDATVILFWFANSEIIDKMKQKFEKLNEGCKVITIWGPLPGCLPDEVDFPFIINQTPFKPAKNLQEQLLSIFGVKCVDFITAWEFAERYTKAIEAIESENGRFLTIIQSLVIWINAKNLGVACGDEIPEPIKAYIGILRNFFNIDVEHLLKE